MRLLLVLTIATLAASSPAQEPAGPLAPEPTFSIKPSSLLDPSRLSMSQSYSFLYTSGGGGRSLGMYMSTIEYRLSGAAELRVDLGVLHEPFALVGGGRGDVSTRVLPAVELDYRPWRSFHLNVRFSTIPTVLDRPGWLYDSWD